MSNLTMPAAKTNAAGQSYGDMDNTGAMSDKGRTAKNRNRTSNMNSSTRSPMTDTDGSSMPAERTARMDRG